MTAISGRTTRQQRYRLDVPMAKAMELGEPTIGDLQLVLPHTASGVAKLIFQLVAPDGAIIADAATVINMRPNPRANASSSNINPEFTQVEVRAQGPEATGVAENPANLAAALAGDPVPLPSQASHTNHEPC